MISTLVFLVVLTRVTSAGTLIDTVSSSSSVIITPGFTTITVEWDPTTADHSSVEITLNNTVLYQQVICDGMPGRHVVTGIPPGMALDVKVTFSGGSDGRAKLLQRVTMLSIGRSSFP